MHDLLLIGVVALVTVVIRTLPFLVFKNKKQCNYRIFRGCFTLCYYGYAGCLLFKECEFINWKSWYM